jgi:hypothetical protein
LSEEGEERRIHPAGRGRNEVLPDESGVPDQEFGIKLPSSTLDSKRSNLMLQPGGEMAEWLKATVC